MKKSIQLFSILVMAGILLFATTAAAEPPKLQTPKDLKVPVAQDRQPGGSAISLSATLSAEPASQSVNCPVTVGFKGKITLTSDKLILTSPVVVQYRFKRSDGVVDTDIKTLTFTKPGSQDVSQTWGKLGGGSDRALVYCGWQSIEILSPQKVESNKAEFAFHCLNVQQPDLRITDMFSVPLGNNQCTVSIKMKNFGAPINPHPDLRSTCPIGIIMYDVGYWLKGTWCNSLQKCFTLDPVIEEHVTTGGEFTTGLSYAFTQNFNQSSPYTLKLKLTRKVVLRFQDLPLWQGTEYSMTKALTCP